MKVTTLAVKKQEKLKQSFKRKLQKQERIVEIEVLSFLLAKAIKNKPRVNQML